MVDMDIDPERDGPWADLHRAMDKAEKRIELSPEELRDLLDDARRAAIVERDAEWEAHLGHGEGDVSEPGREGYDETGARIEAAQEIAAALGVTDEVERLAALGAEPDAIAHALAGRFREIDQIAGTDGVDPAHAARGFVRDVEAGLGIPAPESGEAREAWRERRFDLAVPENRLTPGGAVDRRQVEHWHGLAMAAYPERETERPDQAEIADRLDEAEEIDPARERVTVAREIADEMGITRDVERLAARGFGPDTAAWVMAERIKLIGDAAEMFGEDRKLALLDFVTDVEVSLDIPAPEQVEAREEWRRLNHGLAQEADEPAPGREADAERLALWTDLHLREEPTPAPPAPEPGLPPPEAPGSGEAGAGAVTDGENAIELVSGPEPEIQAAARPLVDPENQSRILADLAAIRGQERQRIEEESRQRPRIAPGPIAGGVTIKSLDAAPPVREAEPEAPGDAQADGPGRAVIDERERKRRADLLDQIHRNYRAKGADWHFKDNPAKVAFTDKGRRLSTQHTDERVSFAMAAMAEARGWSTIKVSGQPEFRRQVWLEASLRGIAVQGFRPTEQDLKELAEIRERAMRNSVEQGGPERSRDAAPETRPDPTPAAPAGGAGKTNSQAPSQPVAQAPAEPEAPKPAEAEPARQDGKEALRIHEGRLIEHGAAPYKNEKDASPSYFVTLETDAGKPRTIWGLDLKRGMEESGARPGDRLHLEYLGNKPVTVKQIERDEAGRAVGTKEVQSHRNTWKVEKSEKEQVLETAMQGVLNKQIADPHLREELMRMAREEIGQRARSGQLPQVMVYDHKAPPLRRAPKPEIQKQPQREVKRDVEPER